MVRSIRGEGEDGRESEGTVGTEMLTVRLA